MKFQGLELVSNALCIVGESPVWDEKRNSLHYVDIQGKRLRTLNLSKGETHDTVLNQQAGCIALCDDGGLIAGMEDGVYFLSPDGKTELASKPFKMEGFRFNDGKIGPDGNFYLGTISRISEGALYRMSPNGEMKKLLGGIGNSNGIDWDINKNVMYFNDTPTLKTDVFDFENGNISNRKTVFEYLNSGNPDGMTLDSEGKLWVALWGASKIARLDTESKKIIETVDIPVPNAACCVFGGSDMRDLYITTASHFTDLRKYPLAGAVFQVRTSVCGNKPYIFKKQK